MVKLTEKQAWTFWTHFMYIIPNGPMIGATQDFLATHTNKQIEVATNRALAKALKNGPDI